MPRPDETSRLRRVLMQSIMWFILAATVGLAALVDAQKTRRSAVTLGEPQRIENVSLQLPKDWGTVIGGERMSRDALLEVHEDTDDLSARVIDVRIDQPSLLDAFRVRQNPVMTINGVPFGDGSAPLKVYNLVENDPEEGATFYIQRFEIARPISNFRVLTLQLSHAGIDPGNRNNGSLMNEDIELMKKIAGTLKVER